MAHFFPVREFMMTAHQWFIRPRKSARSAKARLSLKVLITITAISLIALSITSAWAGNGIPSNRYPAGYSTTGQVDADTFSVGDTKLFWAYAQGFFQGYYPLSATCQMKGDNSYLFTEDAYINDITATFDDPAIIFVAANGGVFKSADGGMNWELAVGGLPREDGNGNYQSFDSTNYNHRALMNCLFSRAEYGETADTIWVGTEFGPFWSTAEGDTFKLRATGIPIEPDDEIKPPVYDILGHPVDTRTLWCATEDGVFMTRNANRWKDLWGGLPPGEGASWESAPAYALAYLPDDDLLFTCSAKGLFYGTPRPLGTSANSEIIASWKPLGGEIGISDDTTQTNTGAIFYLLVENATTKGLTITPGQNITVIDTVNDIYWATLVDEVSYGLVATLADSLISYYPTGSTPPTVDYLTLNLNNLITFGYSQFTGQALYAEKDGDTTTVWLGTEDGGLTSYRFVGDITDVYSSSLEVIQSSHDDTLIYKITKKADTYYFATTGGLYSAADPHGEWTMLSGYVYNNDGSDSLNVDVRTVAFGHDDYIFTGGYMGGFQWSDDGIDFSSSNLGLINKNGTENQLAIFLDQFEDEIPADPTKGIYETSQDWWGSLPPSSSVDDIDGDSRVVILFLNIDDQYYLGTGDGTYISGHYDGYNEYSRLFFAQSNQAEMFYLDTDPLWINEAGAAACNQMFSLINWNQDFDEEQWITGGLASLSQHVAGYPVATGTITFPLDNELTAWGDKNIDVEHLHAFLLMLYLYEQVFPDDINGSQTTHTIADIATSPYHGTSGLGLLIHLQGGGTVPENDTTDYTPIFASYFEDFIIASALDISDTTFFGGKYGYDAVDTKISASDKNWYYSAVPPPPYDFNIPFWSGRAFQIQDLTFPQGYFNPDHPITEVKVNGDDRNSYSFYLLLSDTSTFYPSTPSDLVDIVTFMQIPTDTLKQKGELTLPVELQLLGTFDPPNNMRVLTICTSNSGDAPGCYVFGDDMEPPPYLNLTVAQNPIDEHYIDVYSFTQERLFPDGGQLYRVESIGLTELEGPEVDITGGISTETGGDTLITLDQDVFYSNQQASDFIYHIAQHLEEIEFPANLEFTAYCEDANGNEKASAPLPVSIDCIEGLTGGTIRILQSGVSVAIPPMAMDDDHIILLSLSQYPDNPAPAGSGWSVFADPDPSHTAVGPILSAGSTSLGLSVPIEVEIPYNATLAGNSDVGVYRAEGDTWVYVGGTSLSEGLLKTYSWKFGQFQVFAGPLEDMTPEMPYRFGLGQNYPNPFNPATKIQFELTRSQNVDVDIFNVMGKLVTRLFEGRYEAGHHVIRWNADNFSSGVYFLRLQAEEGTLYRKMMLLK
ncbi:hypothetical protein CEE37_07730 [candidate division LCP-89 bacterium B3_LCP]|uniref:ZU5 domain-containing protein n=1 Tax=candidate division LCP-89 bacterium B3_LCP TaxID=2012998 RepID=A0A532V0V2_UNCL8|nr:MAG: hypothetical protein CEE37_07730 [candidate division LCP-89 bacterium B3_LCP]